MAAYIPPDTRTYFIFTVAGKVGKKLIIRKSCDED